MRKEVSERPRLSEKDMERLDKVFAKEPNIEDIPELDMGVLVKMRRRKGMFTPEQLTKIATEAKERRVTRPVTVRLPVSVIEKYKETGKGYTTLMSEILKEASRAL